LLQDDWNHLKSNPSWYALITLGFIKETTVFFLFLFIAARNLLYFYHLFKKEADIKRIIHEITIILLLLIPNIIYLYFRYMLKTRPYLPDPTLLLDLQLYGVLIYSFLEQFGGFLILFLLGMWSLLKRKQYHILLFFTLIIIVLPPFYMVVANGMLTGNPRYNLYIIPPVLCASCLFLNIIAQKGRKYLLAVLCTILLINFIISPIRSDGVKKAYWGGYLCDYNEHYYPFPETLSWISKNHRTEKIMFAGMSYKYYFDFYLKKLNWFPQYDTLVVNANFEQIAKDHLYVWNEKRLKNLIKNCVKENYNVIVILPHNENLNTFSDLIEGYKKKIFKNSEHFLIVYYKK